MPWIFCWVHFSPFLGFHLGNQIFISRFRNFILMKHRTLDLMTVISIKKIIFIFSQIKYTVHLLQKYLVCHVRKIYRFDLKFTVLAQKTVYFPHLLHNILSCCCIIISYITKKTYYDCIPWIYLTLNLIRSLASTCLLLSITTKSLF